MKEKSPRRMIVETLHDKAVMKQVVYNNTKNAFDSIKQVLQNTVGELVAEAGDLKEKVGINYRTKSEFECETKVAGDILVFHMHTNIFQFDKSHHIWKTSYVKEDNQRAYCGMINVYNFLADSFKYNRENDAGYLIARIFINKDNHCFVEGKRQLGFLYNDFAEVEINQEKIGSIIESAILYVLDFDLLTPSYDSMKEVTVQEIQEIMKNTKFRTGKRLGFQFRADTDKIE